MLSLGKCIIWLIFSVTSVVYGDELISAVVIFRHGIRTPLGFHPTDPYQNASYWPVAPGELTEEGRAQEHKLGEWMRNRYQHFLPKHYLPSDFFIISSAFNRTIASAKAFCAGLYPDEIIPITYMPLKDGYIINSDRQCPRYNQLFEELLKSQFFKNLDEENVELYKYISKYSGLNVTTFRGLERIYDTLLIEDIYNFTLPDWTKEIYPEKLEKTAFLNLLLPSYNMQLARFRQGPILNEITTYFQTFLNQSLVLDTEFVTNRIVGRKMLAISGHDTNIIGLRNVFKNLEIKWQPFANAMIFELHKRGNSELYVNSFYKNETHLERIKVGGSGFDLKLSDFIRYVQPLVINKKNWEEECSKKEA